MQFERIEYPGIIVADAAAEEYESSEFFQLLLESVQDYAIFMLDPYGFIRTWNTGAQRSKGYLANEIVGQHFSIFYTPEDRLANRPHKLLQLAATQGRIEDEGWRLRKDGTRFWADVILTPLFNRDGHLRGFAKVTRDMTERRSIYKAMEEALNASRAKSAFLANMSHELRTPLNAIIGYAEMLHEQLASTDLQADVEKIIYSSRHLISIISDILDLSRVEAGKLALNNEVLDVLQLVHEVVETARPLAEKNRNQVKVTATCSTARIEADPVRLRQVLYNIFSNACKFTENGRIDVRVTSAKGEIEIRITDTGVGMSKEEQGKIFENFYQIQKDQSPDAKRGGTGLGLAISKLLVEAMGGKISVSSELGKGSSFYILMPNTLPAAALDLE